MTSLALIGYGRWGKNLARVMHKMGVLQCIVEASQDTMVDANLRYHDIPVLRNLSFDNLQQMDVTGVVIATPAETHFSLADGCMSHGLDVFVEKPMALSVKEAEEMVLCAKVNQKKLFVGHVFEYHPAMIQIVDLVKVGYLGAIEYISSHQLGPGRARDKESVVFSLAPHDVSMVLRIMGAAGKIGIEPKRVSAFGVSHSEAGVAGTAGINIDFGGVTKAHVHVSWMNPQKRRQLTVIGSKRSLVFDDVKKELIAYDRTGDINAYAKEGSVVFYDSTIEPLQMEMEAFVQYLDSNVAPTTTGEKALSVVKVLEAAQLSMTKNGASVEVIG